MPDAGFEGETVKQWCRTTRHAALERRLGEVLAKMVKRGGDRRANGQCDRLIPPELGEKHARQNTSKRAQQLARVPWQEIAERIDQETAKNKRPVRRGATVVMLLPARTDTSYWHRWVVGGEIRFLPGRLRFGRAAHSAPFPSAVVVFRPLRLATACECRGGW